jgi:Uma2 family endonuclease
MRWEYNISMGQLIILMKVEGKYMDALKLNNYTVDDIYALPEDECAELINGQIYYMASPDRRHQSIASELHFHKKIKSGIYEDLEIDFGTI